MPRKNKRGHARRAETDRERQALELGRKAFEEGRSAVPALDPELAKMYDGRGDVILVLEAWIRGWHRANAAAPVPGL